MKVCTYGLRDNTNVRRPQTKRVEVFSVWIYKWASDRALSSFHGVNVDWSDWFEAKADLGLLSGRQA